MTVNASTGVYSAPAVATNAAAGKVIDSADWNAVFADIVAGINSKALITSPPTSQTTTYTVAATDYSIIFTGATTVTLPAAASFGGRILLMKVTANAAVSSATSNVVAITGGAASTPILAATSGKWAILQSDATNWIIMAAN
jgi:hypothetical protein